MPHFEYPSDSPSVGLRDDIGQIVQWPTVDAFGADLADKEFLTFAHLDATHFVVAKRIEPDMTFALRPMPAQTSAPSTPPAPQGTNAPPVSATAITLLRNAEGQLINPNTNEPFVILIPLDDGQEKRVTHIWFDGERDAEAADTPTVNDLNLTPSPDEPPADMPTAEAPARRARRTASG